MRGGRLGSRVDEGRSEIRKVLRIARFRESMTIRMHRRPLLALGRREDASATSPRPSALPDGRRRRPWTEHPTARRRVRSSPFDSSARSRRTRGVEGTSLRCRRRGNPLNLSISLSGGRETKPDAPSSGERTGPNPSVETRLSRVVVCRLRITSVAPSDEMAMELAASGG